MFTLEPKSFHCPAGDSWCSLDSPPPLEEVVTCTGATHYDGYSVIAVCIKYLNAPDGQYIAEIALNGDSLSSCCK